MTTPHEIAIGFLLFPGVTQLDLTGPYEVLARVPGAKLHLLWKTLDAVVSDTGLAMLPTTTLAACPPLEMICVPGGPGQIALMDDVEVLAFLARIAPDCRFVTSVCTGALVLGAAGLLKGYRATCHWASIDQLALLGAEPVAERVVRDRNRITGGGVTSGIDFALMVAAELAGRGVAEEIALGIEYDPAPPVACGSPRIAERAFVDRVRDGMADFIARRRVATERAAARLEPRRPG